MTTHTIVALFDDYPQAEGAIRELEMAGIPASDINLLANNAGSRYGDYPEYGANRVEPADTGSGAGAGAGIGAVLGGAAGLLAGIGALAIPGVGPVVAAGALAATLAGAGIGAAVGGLVGALVDAGIPREHADIYAEAVRRGGTLVTVRAGDEWQNRATEILNRHSPVDIEERAENWRQSGWTGFDDRAGTYAGSAYGHETAGARSTSSPISGPTDTKPAWQAGEPVGGTTGGLTGTQPAARDRGSEPGSTPGSGAGELQRDWEVRRDDSRVLDAAARRSGVRIYPQVEEGVGDKR
jgi:hypothetical protein